MFLLDFFRRRYALVKQKQIRLPADFWRHRSIKYLVGLVIIAALYGYATLHAETVLESILFQLSCFGIASVWIITNTQFTIQGVFNSEAFRSIKLSPAWILVFFAIILRLYSLTFMPPANQAGFEETETGTIAFRILQTGVLPVEFRFTNLLGALGFILVHSSHLAALRLMYQIMGLVSLLLMALSFRELKVNWTITLSMVFLAATMRLLVLGGGMADELFAPVVLVMAFIWSLLKAENSRAYSHFWSALAGILAGMILFEYVSFRVVIFAGLALLLYRCLSRKDAGEYTGRSQRWFNLFSFVVTMLVVAAPDMVQIIHSPGANAFLDGFRRHGIERPTIFSAESINHIKQYLLGLAGRPAESSAYITIPNESIIHPVIGGLFLISFFYGSLQKNNAFLRIFAAIIFLSAAGAGISANNVEFRRMCPLILMLLMMSGALIQAVYSGIGREIQKRLKDQAIELVIPLQWVHKKSNVPTTQLIAVQPTADGSSLKHSFKDVVISYQKITEVGFKAGFTISLLLFTGLICSENINSIRRMTVNKAVINEYVNDDYSVCSFIGTIVSQNQRVYLVSSAGLYQCSPIPAEGWYFNGRFPKIINLLKFPTKDELAPGDLVVAGSRNEALDEASLTLINNLAVETNSMDSIQHGKNIAGRVTAASVCIQCTTPQK